MMMQPPPMPPMPPYQPQPPYPGMMQQPPPIYPGMMNQQPLGGMPFSGGVVPRMMGLGSSSNQDRDRPNPRPNPRNRPGPNRDFPQPRFAPIPWGMAPPDIRDVLHQQMASAMALPPQSTASAQFRKGLPKLLGKDKKDKD